MASKSRGRKTGTSAGSTRKAKNATPLDDALTSSGAVALVVEGAPTAIVPSEAALPAAEERASQTEAAEPAKPIRRRSRKAAPTTAPSAEEAAPTPEESASPKDGAAPAKQIRRRSGKAASTTAPTAEEAAPTSAPRKRTRKAKPEPTAVAEPQAELAPTVEPDPIPAVDDAAFGDAFAGAFLYTPERELEPEAPAAEPAPEAAVEEAAEAKVDLPFIIDIPREVPVVDDAPADEWVERILASRPGQAKPAEGWVDQVLEPTKAAIPPRPRTQAGRSAVRPAAKPVPKAAPKAAPKPVTKAASATPGGVGKSPNDAASATRWWMLLPVFLVLAVVLLVNRPGKTHAPVPDGVLGTWTTAFWLYEHQTLEIKPDTIVATLDETDEGRFPITKVETSDAGRELAVKITYQDAHGDEKVIDLLADKDPTTALRFRAHTGLVWVKAE